MQNHLRIILPLQKVLLPHHADCGRVGQRGQGEEKGCPPCQLGEQWHWLQFCCPSTNLQETGTLALRSCLHSRLETNQSCLKKKKNVDLLLKTCECLVYFHFQWNVKSHNSVENVTCVICCPRVAGKAHCRLIIMADDYDANRILNAGKFQFAICLIFNFQFQSMNVHYFSQQKA